MKDTSVGKEVLAYCTQCRMDLAHIIVAMKGDKIAKAECKTCKKTHGYKAPKGITEPTPKVKKSRSKVPSAEAQMATVHEMWNKLMEDHKATPQKNYNTKANFGLGDRIMHKAFGEGFVNRLIYPNKMEVVFQNDLKILIHGSPK